ncbi:hypothetical protein PO883_09390 [Massilia sp. DJPM01]|uniref:hypothetical protein n=1 Tax=Massilia sp. DJPM01 TaxID=3024404 RepID=UPI00259F1780|nr:hypothetical protein [Massilia sp. DJPM01]MDM5177402.1 hypothetical protein [Massilia sp. DJPM01]
MKALISRVPLVFSLSGMHKEIGLLRFFKRKLVPAPSQRGPAETAPMDAELTSCFARMTERRQA